MRAATLKALAIHTADEAGDDDGPDYEFGWGLLNTKSAVQLISTIGANHQLIEDTLSNDATQVVEVSTGEANARVTATLVWADPPGTPVAPALDPTDLMLVNDLDLRITHGTTTHMPWVLNPGNPAAAATTGDNYRDNVEQVRADGGGAGTYFIEVSHKGTLLDGNSQPYSLIISVTTAPPTTSSLLIDEDFSGVTLPNADWFVDTTSGVSWTIGRFGGSPHPDNLTGGSGEFAIVDPHFNSITRSSLRTVPFDLSTAEAVVLRFNSYLYYDFFETLNVDVSTNGGGSWLNVWTFSGFNPFPTLYTLDLTGLAAGQPSATFRFRFDSLGDIQGDVWQIDDVELEVFGGEPSEDPPAAASNPDPADGASGMGLETFLTWSAGSLATSHNVYLGGVFQGNQTGTTFAPASLEYGTSYNWRIDEVNSAGTTTGTLWTFETGSAPTSPEFRVVAVSVEVVNDKGPRNKGVATITVTDGDASPVAGVVIDGLFSGDWSGSREGTTDSSGQVVLETPPVKNGSAWQFCVASASKAGWVFDQGGSTGLCGAPPPLGAVSGIVTDAATTLPISGASIGTDAGQSDTTDAAGLYSLADVPVGSRMVTVSAAGYDSASSPVSVSEAATSTLDFALTAATGGGFGTVKGVVSSDTGDLLEGAIVHVSGGPSAATNKRGKYSIRDVAAGMLTVTASLPGFADSTTQVTLAAGSTVTLDFTLSPN